VFNYVIKNTSLVLMKCQRPARSYCSSGNRILVSDVMILTSRCARIIRIGSCMVKGEVDMNEKLLHKAQSREGHVQIYKNVYNMRL
jgi:hypothetical protein